MKKIDLINILKEQISFDNWKMPSIEQLELEFHVEHELKGNYFFENEDDFFEAVENGIVEKITRGEDYKIDYRSHTSSKESLLSLIRGYRSYPQFRNEKTVEAIYEGFKENKLMDLPIVIEFKNGRRRIFCGNTRLDIAFQLGIEPKVLVIKSTVR